MSPTDIVESEDHIENRTTLLRAWRSVPELRVGWKKTAALTLVGALGRLVVPLLLRQAIDNGFRGSAVHVAYVVKLSLFGAAAIVLTAWANRTATVRLGSTSERGLAVLRERVVQKILDLSLQQHSDQRRGVLVARVTSDIESLSEFFSWSAISLLTGAVVMTVVGATMILISWQLAIVTFVVMVPVVPFARFMQRKLRASHNEVREHVGSYLGQVSELIGGASLIRAYRVEATVGASTIAASDRRRKTSVKAGIQNAILGVGNQVLEVLAIIAVILAGLWLSTRAGADHQLSAGTLVGFVFLVSRFVEPLAELSEVVDQTQRAAAGMTRVLDVLDIASSVSDPAHPRPLPAGKLSITFKNVEFSYPTRSTSGYESDSDSDNARDSATINEVPTVNELDDELLRSFALANLNLHFEAGQTVAVVGATGSGKSTLAKLLVRTADPTAGEIYLADVPIADVSFAELRSRVQLVPQDPFLFDSTIAANIAMADPSLSEEQQLSLFHDLGLGEWIQSLPLGLYTEVGERGALLSAGERQLVVLARTKACNLDVLVLDEATSSVDAATEARLADTIASLSAGRTTIVIAHRLTTAARADRILVMDNGVVVEDGTPAELAQRQNGHYATLWTAWQAASLSS
jgi:ATP-binding cassette, subfamily B, bacterial